MVFPPSVETSSSPMQKKPKKSPNMKRFACTIVALSLVPLVTSECVVNTIESNKTCVFPFTIFTDNKDGNGSAENNTYFECTTDHDPDKRPWCATKVDSNGVFLKKQWDYCDLESQSCNDDGTELRTVDILGKIRSAVQHQFLKRRIILCFWNQFSILIF